MADFQVRGDRAIRRHWTLVCLAFSFCWHAGQTQAVTPAAGPRHQRRRPRRPRRGPSNVSIQAAATAQAAGIGVSWPQALRRVRARLAPWLWVQRCWRGWSTSPPPRQLQQALDWVMA